MAPYIWPPRGVPVRFWTFGTPRATAADGHTWQLHVWRRSSYPHRGLLERLSARTWSWGCVFDAVVAVGKQPEWCHPENRLGPSRIAPATQKPAAIAGNSFTHLTDGMDAQGAPSADEPARMRGWSQRRPCLQTVGAVSTSGPSSELKAFQSRGGQTLRWNPWP